MSSYKHVFFQEAFDFMLSAQDRLKTWRHASPYNPMNPFYLHALFLSYIGLVLVALVCACALPLLVLHRYFLPIMWCIFVSCSTVEIAVANRGSTTKKTYGVSWWSSSCRNYEGIQNKPEKNTQWRNLSHTCTHKCIHKSLLLVFCGSKLSCLISCNASPLSTLACFTMVSCLVSLYV